jgi:uncharacterized membrane protein
MNRNYYLAAMLLTAAVLVATLVAYPLLPASVPTHWNLHNHADGYSPKWALFLLGPGLMAASMLLMYFLPWLSPKNFELDRFRSTYLQMMLMLVTMLGYFSVVVLWAGIGHPLNVGRAFVGGVCLIFALLGNLMGKVRRNFYIGVRTPWTLANERVWNATHRVAAKTLVAGGLLGLALTAAGLDGRSVIVVLLAGAIVPIAYSLISNSNAAASSDFTSPSSRPAVSHRRVPPCTKPRHPRIGSSPRMVGVPHSWETPDSCGGRSASALRESSPI